MSIGQLQKRKFRTREFGTINLYSADEKLQQSLPELRLPPMADAARADGAQGLMFGAST